MKHTLLVVAFVLLSQTAWSEQVVHRVSWADLASAGAIDVGTVVEASSGEGPSLRLVHTEATPATFHLVTIEQPRIGTSRYAIRGRVRYDGVSSGSCLEMWSHLAEGAFFSRGLADSGPMQRLEGSSDWRAFVLPFQNREGGQPPRTLVVNLVLTGTGTVEIGPLELVEISSDDDLSDQAGAWWNDRQAGLLGAMGGTALGLLGTLIGWLGSAGRARAFVLGALRVVTFLGIGTLLFGALAVQRGQPYAVYYPLLLMGVIGAGLGFSLRRSLNKRYERLELRRMQALDA